MRTTVPLCALLTLLGAAGAARAEIGAGALAGTVVDAETLQPVAGATVIVTPSDQSPLVASGRTDAEGGFAFALPAGRYDVLAIFGNARWLRHGVVVDDARTAHARGVLSIAPEEVTIHERAGRAQPPRPARPIASTVKAILPYSDEAIAANLWAVGWVLLEIDDRGAVDGFRFLRRPGHGLDEIARREVFGLRFEPARDDRGRPTSSQVLWKLEWPSFHYSVDARPSAQGAVARGPRPTSEPVIDQRVALTTTSALRFAMKPLPPCAGDGPLRLASADAVYRDCSPPELGLAVSEPIIRAR